MFLLFEEAGKFQAGRVLSQTDASVQVELDSGKRVKVKAAHILLRFARPAPADLIEAGQRLALDIDLDLAWEFAPEADFGFGEFARDYFDASAGPEHQAAALFRLFEAPHYFRRVGKGVFRKAPEAICSFALDEGSRTSSALAQVLLSQKLGVREPQTRLAGHALRRLLTRKMGHVRHWQICSPTTIC